MDKWFDCNDCLPDTNKRVLVYDPQTGIFVCTIIPKINRGINWFGIPYLWAVDGSSSDGFTQDQVTHWMKLPKNPNELLSSPLKTSNEDSKFYKIGYRTAARDITSILKNNSDENAQKIESYILFIQQEIDKLLNQWNTIDE